MSALAIHRRFPWSMSIPQSFLFETCVSDLGWKSGLARHNMSTNPLVPLLPTTMSTCRFRSISTVAIGLFLPTVGFMNVLALVKSDERDAAYASLIYQIVHPLHLLVILTLRWFYETPLETVQEVERLRKPEGRWAQAGLKPQRTEPMGEYNLSDYVFYKDAGTYICVALAHWVFWLWLVFPVQYWFLTIPPAFAGAIYIWQSRMSFLGPSYQFACDREIEDREDAMSKV
ncbi:hypothetical protein BDZ89DRAFT_1133859 [Hymenopellis radicata]|nr:hypothetical protein BDZ89DRAFT_1133859 [Hymenopellis radicata]